jgi:hypothetical protein
MILGAGARALGEHAAEQRQLKHEADQHFLETIDDHLKQHPEDAATPEFAKYGKKIYGEHWEPMQQILGFAAQAKQKEQQQFQELTGGGGQPSSQPMTGASPTPGQGQPAAGSLPSPAASPQSQFKMPQSADEWEAYRHKLIQARGHFTDPGHLKALDDEISFAKDQTDKAEKHTEVEENRADRQQFHQDTEADRAATRASAAESRALSQSLKASQDAFERDYKTNQQALEKERDDATKQARTETLKKTIDTEVDKITADFAAAAGKGNPDDIKSAFKARADSYNSSASMFYRKHADAGAPTLLKFKQGVAGTGLRGTMGMGTPGESPSLEAVPPQYGNYKGKSGWLDADGNFYPDAGTN